MTRQIVVAHDRFLEQTLTDPQFVQRIAAHVQHARLSAILPSTPGATVLELGCGPGKYVAILDRLGFDVTGVDPVTFPSWEILRRQTRARLLDGVRAEQLPFADGTFDHVVCLGTLLYVDDPGLALTEMARVIRPGGRLVVRTVNRTNLYSRRTGQVIDPASKNLYSLDELAAAVERHGFTVDERFSYGFLPPVFKNFWWYLVSVWLPLSVQDRLSDLLAPSRRWNNTVVATAGAGG